MGAQTVLILPDTTVPLNDVKNLVLSAHRTYGVLQPWFDTRVNTELEEMRIIVSAVQAQGRSFIKAIDLSVRTSETGTKFAKTAGILCEQILKGTAADEHLELLNGLHRLAKKGHTDANSTLFQFRQAKLGVLEMTKQIPVIVDQAVRKHRAIEASRKRNEILSQCAEKVGNVCSDLTGSHIPSIIPINGADIIFSIMGPAVSLMAGVVEERGKAKAKDRSQEATSHNQLILQLKAAELGMSDLLQNTTSFATWWTMAETQLRHLEDRIHKGAASIDNVWLVQVKNGWDRIHNLYNGYILEISKIQEDHRAGCLGDNIGRLLEDCEQSSAAFINQVVSLAIAVEQCQEGFYRVRNTAPIIRNSHVKEFHSKIAVIKGAMQNEFQACVDLFSLLSDAYTGEDSVDNARNIAQQILQRHRDTEKEVSDDGQGSLEQLLSHEVSIHKTHHLRDLWNAVHGMQSQGEVGLQTLASFEDAIHKLGNLCTQLSLADFSEVAYTPEGSLVFQYTKEVAERELVVNQSHLSTALEKVRHVLSELDRN